MHPFNRPHIRTRQQGQTLIIALIILGVLLILGLVFLGLIDRNLLNAARTQRRSEASDLAEAGVRYAHGQLVSSPLGADWRGIPTTLAAVSTDPNATGDPDAYYLRPASQIANVPDLGGPDRLGPFVRILFPKGRALVRVRYGASDASPTKLVPGGPLRNPGAARSQIIIEAVGRTGAFNANDPTTYTTSAGIRFQNYATAGDLNTAINAMAQADAQLPTSRRMVAYAPIGIIDAARFETNVFNSSAPIDMGIPEGLGVQAFNDANLAVKSTDPYPTDVGSHLEVQLGTPGDVQGVSGDTLRGSGGFIVNGDLLLHGRLHAYLNRTLGDSIRVAGRITGAQGDRALNTDPASLVITPAAYNPATGTYALGGDFALTETGAEGTIENASTTPVTVAGSFDSQTLAFSTGNGLVYDGSPRTDVAGYPSGVGILVPPSTQTVDPQTKLNRYVAMTRESGVVPVNSNAGNSGQFGHGDGVFVDNVSDRQEAIDATGRAIVGSQQSLFDDWLNPGNGASNTGWKGPFYVPRGAAMQMLPDGFIVQRDGSGPAAERTWKTANGTDSGLSTLRYRIGLNSAGALAIVNTLTFVDLTNVAGTLAAAQQKINGSLNASDFDPKGATDATSTGGQPFNGVLYFEGNVRVRGTIPTAVQMTLVSGATIYIDGPIVKGTTNNNVTGGTIGNPITALPTAALMLMARDNVAVNTTMFFGPTAGQSLESVNDTTGSAGISPVRLRAAGGSDGGSLELLADLALDPTTSTSPASWTPYALNYRQWDATGKAIPTQLLLGSTMDDGTASASFLALNVNFGANETTKPSEYAFLAIDPDGLITNTAAAYTGLTGANQTTPLYGLGAEPWQRYARFELRSFPLITDPTTAAYAAATGTITQGSPYNYLLLSGTNDLLVRPGAVAGVSANDALIGRAAVTPADIQIEASIFAEQGSFFVIPGPWFNPNPNDTHNAYAQRILDLQNTAITNPALSAAQATQRAARERLEAYGTAPGAPFYAEPLDVRVNIVGSVAENLPPPASVQAEWQRKWGWIPRRQAATGIGIPLQHVPGASAAEKNNYITGSNFVPNLIIQYDPILATGRVNDLGNANPLLLRVDEFKRPLPPMPRLPVSPKLSYFGEL